MTATQEGDARTLAGAASTTVHVTAPPAVIDVTIGRDLGERAEGAAVGARATGLRPGSDLVLVVHSTPRVIGTAVVGADGTATVTGVLPTDLEVGAHRLVATGTALDGSAVQLDLGFVVATDGELVRIGDRALALAETGASVESAALLGATWLLLGIGMVAAARRRALRGTR